MAGTHKTGTSNFQDAGKVETHADDLNAVASPVASNPHESNMERMLRQLLRNQETMNARIEQIETGSSRSESKGEPTRSAVGKRSRTFLSPSSHSPPCGKPKRTAEGQTLEFSGEEDNVDEDRDESGFMFVPQYTRRIVKASPPKFNGDSTKFTRWSEAFVRFSIRWRFNPALFCTTEIDVFDHMKCDGDHVEEGIAEPLLYEAQNAWHALLDAAGT